jgi:hypothetical protein
MARRIKEQLQTTVSTPQGCDHPLIAIRLGAPATWRACDPRLMLYTKLSPEVRVRCAQARAEHEVI